MNDYDKLMVQMYEVIGKQNEFPMDSYDFSFYQEKRYRLSEKIEDILPETKKVALHLQRKMHKFGNTQESVEWLAESPDLLHNWDGELHKKYLRKAERLLEKYDYNKVMKMIDIIF